MNDPTALPVTHPDWFPVGRPIVSSRSITVCYGNLGLGVRRTFLLYVDDSGMPRVDLLASDMLGPEDRQVDLETAINDTAVGRSTDRRNP